MSVSNEIRVFKSEFFLGGSIHSSQTLLSSRRVVEYSIFLMHKFLRTQEKCE